MAIVHTPRSFKRHASETARSTHGLVHLYKHYRQVRLPRTLAVPAAAAARHEFGTGSGRCSCCLSRLRFGSAPDVAPTLPGTAGSDLPLQPSSGDAQYFTTAANTRGLMRTVSEFAAIFEAVFSIMCPVFIPCNPIQHFQQISDRCWYRILFHPARAVSSQRWFPQQISVLRCRPSIMAGRRDSEWARTVQCGSRRATPSLTSLSSQDSPAMACGTRRTAGTRRLRTPAC